MQVNPGISSPLAAKKQCYFHPVTFILLEFVNSEDAFSTPYQAFPLLIWTYSSPLTIERLRCSNCSTSPMLFSILQSLCSIPDQLVHTTRSCSSAPPSYVWSHSPTDCSWWFVLSTVLSAHPPGHVWNPATAPFTWVFVQQHHNFLWLPCCLPVLALFLWSLLPIDFVDPLAFVFLHRFSVCAFEISVLLIESLIWISRIDFGDRKLCFQGRALSSWILLGLRPSAWGTASTPRQVGFQARSSSARKEFVELLALKLTHSSSLDSEWFGSFTFCALPLSFRNAVLLPRGSVALRRCWALCVISPCTRIQPALLIGVRGQDRPIFFADACCFQGIHLSNHKLWRTPPWTLPGIQSTVRTQRPSPWSSESEARYFS